MLISRQTRQGRYVKINDIIVSTVAVPIPFQVEWEEVRKEMVEEKGLTEEVADKIGEYVKLHGGKELVERLQADPRLSAVKDAQLGLEDMRLLLNYCELFGVLDNVRATQWNGTV